MAEFMEGTVDVPKMGRVKKAYVMVPVGLAGAYVAYRWYQASRASGEDAPAGSDGLYTSDDLSEYGLSTTGGATNVTGNNGSQSTDGTNPNAIDDNAEWTQRAVELLGNAGYDAQVVYGALGEFLARRALDKAEATIARAALAAAGQPPIGGPFSVIEEATTGGTGTPAAPANLRAWGAHSPTTVGIQWDPVPGAMGYRIYRDLGENVGHSIDTKFSVRGLHPDKAYTLTVAAMSSTGKTGPQSNKITVRTTRVTLKAPTGVKASSVKKNGFRVSWNKVAGADYYRVYVNGVAAGASDTTYYDVIGRKPNTSYKVTVKADTTTQTPGPASGAITVKTKR